VLSVPFLLTGTDLQGLMSQASYFTNFTKCVPAFIVVLRNCSCSDVM
jgi:hypothetical protein